MATPGLAMLQTHRTHSFGGPEAPSKTVSPIFVLSHEYIYNGNKTGASAVIANARTVSILEVEIKNIFEESVEDATYDS